MRKTPKQIRDEVLKQIEKEQDREERWIRIAKQNHRCYRCVWVTWADDRHPVCAFGRCVRGKI